MLKLATMDPPKGKNAEHSYAGSRYYREFISKIRKDQDAGKYEHLEDYPHDVLVDDDLGIRLYHAGINPYDQEHFRHQMYLVVMAEGKASKLCAPDTVVASSLTLQWTKRGDMCNALLLSVKSFGQCTFAWCGDKSRNKCGWCGHNMKTLLWRNKAWKWVPYRRGRPLRNGEKHCCGWNQIMKKYQCCKCKDPDNALMTPLDREEAAEMPQSVLPATIEGYRLSSAQTALVPASAAAPVSSPGTAGSNGAPTTINNFHIYGTNHIFQTSSVGGGPLSDPLALSLSGHDMEKVTRQWQYYAAALSSATSPPEPSGAGRIQEIEDEAPGLDSSRYGTPRKYFSPRVEDEEAQQEVADVTGVAEPLKSLGINK